MVSKSPNWGCSPSKWPFYLYGLFRGLTGTILQVHSPKTIKMIPKNDGLKRTCKQKRLQILGIILGIYMLNFVGGALKVC